MKPSVFIGSSSEGLDAARAVELQLNRDCEVRLWPHDVFQLGQSCLESLVNELEQVEFAVLIITPDDTRNKRGNEAKIPRDNVVFEMGLFMGRLGRQRAFAIADGAAILPTDLEGINVARYNADRADGSLDNALSPAVTKIIRAVKKAPRLAAATNRLVGSDNLFLDEDALCNAIAAWPSTMGETIVSRRMTSWFWRLFPTVLRWRMEGMKVTVFAKKIGKSHPEYRKETARRALLRQMGVQLRERPKLATTGFFYRSKYLDDSIAVEVNEGNDSGPLGVRYDGSTNPKAMEALFQCLPRVSACHLDSNHVPQLQPHRADDVIRLLREGVQQYRPSRVELRLETVEPSELHLISRFARAYKYKQIGQLIDAYQYLGTEPFEPLAVVLASSELSIVTPPVVELRDVGYVVIEGTTRATFSYKNERSALRCIQVTGVREPLPGDPVHIREVDIVERELAPEEKTPKWAYKHFRHVERAVHPY